MSTLPISDDRRFPELGALVGANLHALFRAMVDHLPGAELEETSRLCRHHTYPTNPMFKGVWRTRLEPQQAEDAIDESIEWFRSRGAPYFFWWTTARVTPADLGERLAARGLVSMEGQQRTLASGVLSSAAGAPEMAADLHHMDESLLERVPRGFRIEEVEDADALDDFKRVFVETYGIPEWAGQAWVDATRRIGIGRTPWRFFVGRIAGEPVATNMLFNGGGVASVYAVATLPRVQGRGIGSAITLAPLLEARAEGYRYAALFSTDAAVRIYERMGFKHCGTRIDRWLWRAERG